MFLQHASQIVFNQAYHPHEYCLPSCAMSCSAWGCYCCWGHEAVWCMASGHCLNKRAWLAAMGGMAERTL